MRRFLILALLPMAAHAQQFTPEQLIQLQQMQQRQQQAQQPPQPLYQAPSVQYNPTGAAMQAQQLQNLRLQNQIMQQQLQNQRQ